MYTYICIGMVLFLGLITRCKDEYFIKEFCDYYLSQGIDHIYVIDDDSDDKTIYDELTSNNKRYLNHITIIYKKNMFIGNSQMREVNALYKQIKQKYKWLISVDADEFITTKKNINKTIRHELQTTFKNVDCIKIPWVMMSCNHKEMVNSPPSILESIIYRWNHDLKHPNPIRKFSCRYKKIQVKCIFQTYAFNTIFIHHPYDKCIKNEPKIVCSIDLKKQSLTPFYNGLREKHISNGHMLCYHYRIISVENCKNKLKTNVKYQDMKYTLADLLSSDHPEIIDYTLHIKHKMQKEQNKE